MKPLASINNGPIAAGLLLCTLFVIPSGCSVSETIPLRPATETVRFGDETKIDCSISIINRTKVFVHVDVLNQSTRPINIDASQSKLRINDSHEWTLALYRADTNTAIIAAGQTNSLTLIPQGIEPSRQLREDVLSGKPTLELMVAGSDKKKQLLSFTKTIK